MAEWEIWLATDKGIRLKTLNDNLGFTLVKVQNDIGSWQMVYRPDLNKDFLHIDYRLEFWRRADGGTKKLIYTGLLRGWRWETDENGKTLLILFGPDLNDLLRRRVILVPSWAG